MNVHGDYTGDRFRDNRGLRFSKDDLDNIAISKNFVLSPSLTCCGM